MKAFLAILIALSTFHFSANANASGSCGLTILNLHKYLQGKREATFDILELARKKGITLNLAPRPQTGDYVIDSLIDRNGLLEYKPIIMYPKNGRPPETVAIDYSQNLMISYSNNGNLHDIAKQELKYLVEDKDFYNVSSPYEWYGTLVIKKVIYEFQACKDFEAVPRCK